MLSKLTQRLPGVLLAVAIMIAAVLLSAYVPYLGTALLALVIGIIVRQLFKRPAIILPGVVWTEKYILEFAIVLIGFGLETKNLTSIGTESILYILTSVIAVIVFVMFLIRIMTENKNTLWLLGAGSAICGSSAIAATAPIIDAKEEETGIALTVINVLGLIGIATLPMIGYAVNLSETEMGIFLGGILQSVGHVVGASFTISEEVGQVATVIKIGRIALLLPFLTLVYFLFRKSNAGRKIKFPFFILLFAVAMAISMSGMLPQPYLKCLSKAGDVLLNVGMAAIGLKIDIRSLFKISAKGFIAGAAIFAFQIGLFLALLKFS